MAGMWMGSRGSSRRAVLEQQQCLPAYVHALDAALQAQPFTTLFTAPASPSLRAVQDTWRRTRPKAQHRVAAPCRRGCIKGWCVVPRHSVAGGVLGVAS